MIRPPTLYELAALDVLTRQFDAIRQQFQDERLSRYCDAVKRGAQVLVCNPFLAGADGSIDQRRAHRRSTDLPPLR